MSPDHRRLRSDKWEETDDAKTEGYVPEATEKNDEFSIENKDYTSETIQNKQVLVPNVEKRATVENYSIVQ